MFRRKIDEQSEEISRIKQMLDKPEKVPNRDDEMSDDAYWSRMVQEVQASEGQDPPDLANDDDDVEGDWEMRSEDGTEETIEEVNPGRKNDRVVEVVHPEQRLNSRQRDYEQRERELRELTERTQIQDLKYKR
ncbi:hypothetical protein OSTOST_25177 [Ostertagia ostertagi]